MTSIYPVAATVGAGEPQGSANTCHAEATEVSGFAGCDQFNVTELKVSVFVVIAVGCLHDGGGAQVILAIQPSRCPEPLLLKTKVNHPLVAEEVNGHGIVVPQ